MEYLTGFHAVEEALKGAGSKMTLYTSKTNSRIQSLTDLCKKKGIPCRRISSSELSDLIGGGQHRGFCLAAGGSKPGKLQSFEDFIADSSEGNSLVVILDGVTDPHNLGAIIRSADQFGADLVILPQRRSASINSTVAKTSAGASAHVPLTTVSNLSRTVKALQKAGYWVYGADMGGEPIDSVDLTGKTALIMGSEGKGMGDLVSSLCDTILSIPTVGKIDSLNVSVAAGVMMYEVSRQCGRGR